MKLSEMVPEQRRLDNDTFKSKTRALYPDNLKDAKAEIDRLRMEVFRLNHLRYKLFEKAYNKRRYSGGGTRAA